MGLTPHVVALGSLYIARPVPGTANSLYQAVGVPETSDPTERLQRYVFSGINGQAVKKLGTGPARGTVHGFVDGSSAANLQSAKDALAGLKANPSSLTISFLDGTKTYTGIVTDVKFGEIWGYNGRCCQNFMVDWESVG
jgi:hypothetical protein